MQPLLQLLLQEKREELNARFALARHQKRTLSASGFQNFLAAALIPLLEAVAEIQPEQLGLILDTFYEQALQLALRGRIDPDVEGLQVRLWCDLFPRYKNLLGGFHREISARLGNALLQLQGRSEIIAARWMELMIDSAAFCRSLEDVTNSGLLAAWLSGCAEYRTGALAVAGNLPEDLTRTMVPQSEDRPASELFSIWQNNPWFDPAESSKEIRYICRLGGFRGFDGSFAHPPHLRRTDAGVFAGSRDDWFEIQADIFGSHVRRVKLGGAKDIVSDSRAVMLPGGKVVAGSREKSFSCFAGFRDAVCDGTTLFVTLPDSYFVYLLALPGSDL